MNSSAPVDASPSQMTSVHTSEFDYGENNTAEAHFKAFVMDVRVSEAQNRRLHPRTTTELNSLISLDADLSTILHRANPWRVFENLPSLAHAKEDIMLNKVRTHFNISTHEAKRMPNSLIQSFTFSNSVPTYAPTVSDRETSIKPDGLLTLVTEEEMLYKDFYGYALAAEHTVSTGHESTLNVCPSSSNVVLSLITE